MLRTILGRPEFEVVGARVFTPEKHGVDLGELLGMDAIGVNATTSVKELLDLDADCVIHTTQAFDTNSITDEVVQLLESGKNVVSTAAFHYPLMRGPEYAKRLEDACKRGGSSLMGAGLHPSLIVGNFVIPMTSALSSVEHIKVVESVDLSRVMAAMGAGANEVAMAMGFGADPATASEPDSPLNVEGLAAVTIDKGLTVSLIRRQKFYIGDQLFFTNENHWFLGEQNRSPAQNEMPFAGSTSNVNYGVVIDGLPNTARVQFSIDEMDMEGAPPVISLLSINSLIQSIVPVCNAMQGPACFVEKVVFIMRLIYEPWPGNFGQVTFRCPIEQ